ncbi:MAG: DEAD/DEAH box helicase [Pseudooceanicola sp.]|nr:DEAD/DEAH box helicase [Pseudooceanicola sp.]
MTTFTSQLDEQGLWIGIAEERRGLLTRFRKRDRVDFDRLSREDKTLAIVLARLRGLDRDGEHHELTAEHVFLDHWLISRADDLTASVLGLPPRLSGIEFHAEMRGVIGNPSFALDWWWEAGGRQVALTRTGAVVDVGAGRMRLPDQIFDAIELSRAFDSGAPLEAHWRALADFRAALGDSDHDSPARPEGLLRKVAIVTCDRVGLALDPEDPTRFSPLPFVSHALAAGEQPSEASAALQGDELAAFQAKANDRGAQPAYKVGDNRYLILDRSAVPVVEVISRYGRGSKEERMAFIADAERIVSEAIEDSLRRDGRLNEVAAPDEVAEAIEREMGAAWAETREWAARVIEIRKWTKVEIEGFEGSGTGWLPPDMEAALGELLGSIPDEDLADTVRRMEEARTRGESNLQIPQGVVPTHDLVFLALRRRLELYLNRTDSTALADEVTAFLPITRENFWELAFREAQRERPQDMTSGLPDSVCRTLKPHQASAFNWQLRAWTAGLPGILNADEQGLGKTLQTLSFLAWLTARMEAGEVPAAPFLIVAPTSLLRNWEAEIAAHLTPGLWGELVRLYGPGLAGWRSQGARGRDIQDGHSKLDLTALSTNNRPRLAITTYQTLANYAVTFAETAFAVVVFDEIQNLKNPVTLRSNAARAVHADFRIGLTGTPVENATRDIWAIMDQIFPGALGSLVDFRIAFDRPRRGNMAELHRAIFASQAGYPALGIRRTKDRAESLPTKTRILHPRLMPNIQALRYDEARKPGQSLFGLLHHIRRTSLHPGLIEGEPPESFIAASARISAAMDILSAIRAKDERALIFVENRDVQKWFAELVKVTFDLPRVDIINGSTPIALRQVFVERFQRHITEDQGFDVLVMGPRAAGVGLTLTAANHVIHLTRWWNPAVEEQCNDRTHRIGQTKPVTIHIPLAIHPRLQRGSFDCLLQSLMQKKRALAGSVLWPPEGDEAEAQALYDAILGAEEAPAAPSESLSLANCAGIAAEKIGADTFRLRPEVGGASIVVSTLAEGILRATPDEGDAAAILLSSASSNAAPENVPVSRLGGTALWPDFILPGY